MSREIWCGAVDIIRLSVGVSVAKPHVISGAEHMVKAVGANALSNLQLQLWC